MIQDAHLSTRHYDGGTSPCGCPIRILAGFPLTLHRDGCPDGPVDVCAGCGYDVYTDTMDEHAECGQA